MAQLSFLLGSTAESESQASQAHGEGGTDSLQKLWPEPGVWEKTQPQVTAKKTGREHFEGMLMKEGQWSRMAWELSDGGSVFRSREDVQDPRPAKL